MKRFSLLIAAMLAASLVQSAFGAAAPGAQQGQAIVKVVQGTASYTEVAGGQPQPLKPDQVLKAGMTVITGPASTVILDLGENGNALSVKSDSTLSIDTLTLQNTGVDPVVTTELDLKKGSIIGNVKKLSAASRYEVKTQNGVAGIRGTSFQIFAVGIFRCASGQLVVVTRNLRTGQTMTVPVPSGRETVGVTSGTPRTNPMSNDARMTIVGELNILKIVVPGSGGGTSPTLGGDSGRPDNQKGKNRPVGNFDQTSAGADNQHRLDAADAQAILTSAVANALNKGASSAEAIAIGSAAATEFDSLRSRGLTPGQAGAGAASLGNSLSTNRNAVFNNNSVSLATSNATTFATSTPPSNLAPSGVGTSGSGGTTITATDGTSISTTPVLPGIQ